MNDHDIPGPPVEAARPRGYETLPWVEGGTCQASGPTARGERGAALAGVPVRPESC